MKIHHNIPDNKNLFKNPIVTIGSFDGVHRGHQKILATLKAIAKNRNGDPIVITFSSHPKKILNPEIPLKIITTTDEKVNAIFNLGIDNIILLHFTREMANMSALEFYNDILLKKIDMKELVIGYDHAFGKNREGTIDFLNQLSKQTGVTVTRVEEEDLFHRPISSTWIREEIEHGSITMANQILGRPYTLSGTVVHGVGRGRTLSFPTANIKPHDPDKIIPGDGVYAVSIQLGQLLKQGVLNIGNNPTFGHSLKTIEAHIFDFNGDIYDSDISVNFHEKIREEITFPSQDKLIKQMNEDAFKARNILNVLSL